VDIPPEILDWFREVFASANRRLCEKIRNVPAIPEPHLDTTLVEHLSGFAAPRRFPTDWVIQIDTHYIGGLRHFHRRWEIADIGVLIFYQQRGRLVRRKVALLQSKRLYPRNADVQVLERYDYMIGMARLGERDERAPSMLVRRQFEFGEDCRYGALVAGDEQHVAIAAHIERYGFPVFYLFYNPPNVPLAVELPLALNAVQTVDPALGARVIPTSRIFELLDAQGDGYRPTRGDTRKLMAAADVADDYGWRLEHFMSDLLLGCQEGRRFSDDDREAIDALFYRRSGPIAATIAVTVEVPDSVDLGE
jgi:hypothetical protein